MDWIEAWSDIEWTRPWGFAALALPILVLLLARVLGRPPAFFTGTLGLWRELPRSRAETSRRRTRRRIPLSLWILALALGTGALALAGPRPGTRPTSRRWNLFVDKSPSMYLALDGGSRLDAAIAAAEEWLASVRGPADEIEWTTWTGSDFVSASALPAEWRVAPWPPRPEPDWSDSDRPDTIWITDSAPSVLPTRATLVMSGGPAVPGPISVSGTTRFDWDGEHVLEVPDGAPVRELLVAFDFTQPGAPGAAGLDPGLRDMLTAWALDRGFAFGSEQNERTALLFRSSVEEAGREVSLGRDGWTARARVAARGVPPSVEVSGEDVNLETWLAAEVDGESLPVVNRAPGRVESALLSIRDVSGSPAAFAVSWARLLDSVALPAPGELGVVELRERLGAGESGVRPGELSSLEDSPDQVRGARFPLEAWLAVAAAVLAGLSLWIRGTREAARA